MRDGSALLVTRNQPWLPLVKPESCYLQQGAAVGQAKTAEVCDPDVKNLPSPLPWWESMT